MEDLWSLSPLIKPREAAWATSLKRGRKGGRKRVQWAKEARVAQGDRESGVTDPARGPAAVRDAVPP